MNRNQWVIFFCVIFVVSCSASTVVKGNSGSSSTTFNFSVGPIHFVRGGGAMATVLTGAGEQKSGNTFSIAAYSSAVSQFIPVGVSRVTLNNVKDQANPLTGQKIKFLTTARTQKDALLYYAVIDKENIAVPLAQQERFYSFPVVNLPKTTEPTNTEVTLVQSDIPNDANSVSAGYIANVVALRASDMPTKNLMLGAVTENGQNFGIGNSGISAVEFKEEKGYFLNMFNLNTGVAGNKAVSFNNSLAALKVNSDVTINVDTFPVVDMHWNSFLQRLYIAVSVTAAAGASNGARAIVVGRFQNGKLNFEKFIPDGAVTGGSNDNIVGANNGRSASIYKVRTMQTSTGLNYLIVNGGNNAVGESGMRKVANQVYAIPLVNLILATNVNTGWQTSAIQGAAANVTAEPYEDFNSVTHRLHSRTFRTAATTASELFTTSSQAAQVGAGTIPFILPDAPTTARTVRDMFVVGDAVYVSVAESYGYSAGQPQQPGLFQSRAIFDHLGCISAWTPWQRVGGSDDRNYGAQLEAAQGNFWYLTGSDDSNINTVKRTGWGVNTKDGLLGGTTSDASVGLVNIISQQLSGVTGGASAMAQFDANNNVRGIPNSGLTGITTILASGNKKFMLIKTGDNSQATDTIQPYTGNFATNLASNNNGTFPVGSGRVFVVSGGALDQIGPIVTNTVFSNASRSWIAVGGARGLAILSDSTGQGFLPGDMPTNFTFKKLGEYNFVKKVVGDGYFLYVLTNRTLERIAIDPASFVSGTPQRTILMKHTDLGFGNNASFSDLLIGDKLALLATSYGLYRIANGSSIKNSTPLWTYVPLEESTGPMFSFSFASSSTDLNTGLAHRGQVFGLSSYQGYDQARIYRFYVNEGTVLSNDSFTNIGDLFVEGHPSYFFGFGQMRGSYSDDGSMRLVTRPATCCRAQGLFALPFLVYAGSAVFAAGPGTAIDAEIGTLGSIGTAFRSSASGAWLLNGSFGLRVNE